MRETRRSDCPISSSLEIFGDRWTLLIIRDLMFADKRHFREFLQSDERISSNILADRLAVLLEAGIITKTSDSSHKQKAIYSLTERGIELLPILGQIANWGRKYQSPGAPANTPTSSGSPYWDELMDELRELHLTSGVSATP